MIDVLIKSKLIASRGEAKRLLQQGGVDIDGKKVISVNDISLEDGSIVRLGKIKFFKIRLV